VNRGGNVSVRFSVCLQRHDVMTIMTSVRHQQIVHCLWRHQQQRRHGM